MDEAEEGTKRQLIGDAADWLAALDAGSASREEFEAWRSADPRRAVAFAEIAARWQQLGAMQGLAPPAVSEKGADQPGPDRRRFLARAAGILAVAGAGGGAAFLFRDRRHEMITEVGERRTVPLPDGSSVELNTDSRLRWAFGKERALWLLQGEVALTVAADVARPFVVYASDVVARLQRGRFNLRLSGREAEFISLAGAGRVTTHRAALALSPTEAVNISGDVAQSRPMDSVAANNLTAWRNGEIVLDGMSLDQAVSEFNRYLVRKLVVSDASLGTLRLGGRFRVDDPRSFLKALKASFDIDARPQGQTLLLDHA